MKKVPLLPDRYEGEHLKEPHERTSDGTARAVRGVKNFVRTMQQLAERGIAPSVVSDQVGRLTFTRDLAEAIVHLRNGDAPYGTYNVTNGGAPGSWAEVARRVYAHTGRSPSEITEVTTEEYFAGKSVARRPLNSVLDMTKLEATGFTPRDQWEALGEYLAASQP